MKHENKIKLIPTKPLTIGKKDISQMLEEMQEMAFQGKNLAIAFNIWKKMLKDKVTIFLGIAGALIPAGLRNVFVYLIENRLVDCIVSTGANLYHDIHETIGLYHFQGSSKADDEFLHSQGIDRIYDVYAREIDFRSTETFITKFAVDMLSEDKIYTTREFFEIIGSYLSKHKKTEGIVSCAYKNNIPIYCPGIADSAIGIGLFDARHKFNKNIKFDIIGDIAETGGIVEKSNKTGVIYLAGGVPKNFIQQAALIPAFEVGQDFSHEYAIQITADSSHWGGLSGCTFDEAKSWGKISKNAKNVTVNSEVSCVFPFLVSAISNVIEKNPRKYIPEITFSEKGVRVKYLKNEK